MNGVFCIKIRKLQIQPAIAFIGQSIVDSCVQKAKCAAAGCKQHMAVDDLKELVLHGFQSIGMIAQLVEGNPGICQFISDRFCYLLGKIKCVGSLIVALTFQEIRRVLQLIVQSPLNLISDGSDGAEKEQQYNDQECEKNDDGKKVDHQATAHGNSLRLRCRQCGFHFFQA